MNRRFYYIAVLMLIAGQNLFGQSAPVLSDVSILGSPVYSTTEATGATLTGFYNYTDADGDADASTYKWFVDRDDNGKDAGDEVSSGSITYTVSSLDDGHNIYFEVVAADDSPQTGSTTTSAAVAGFQAAYADQDVSDVTHNGGSTLDYLDGTMNNNTTYTVDGSGTTVDFHGDFDLTGKNGITINVTNGAVLTIWGKFITQNNVIIVVDATSAFTVKSGLEAKNGSNLDISGDMTVNGDIDVENNATFTIDAGGSLDVGGDLNFSDGGTNTLEVNGDVAVGGDLTGTADLSGTGSMTVDGEVSGGIDDTANNILPIELTYFKAQYSDNAVNLYWQTATEEKNDYFTIERSNDGLNYEVIATLTGAGYSYTSLNYNYTDNNPLQGISYYRLTQTDYDGASETFNPVSVSFIDENKLNIGPNPTQNHLKISLGGEIGNGSVKLYNLSGALIKDVDLNKLSTTIDINNLPSGSYLLILNAGSTQLSRKIVKE